ncbi:hypothetical protein tloyanaT_12960 [Thalassotalea loyana]|uniref:ASCH domain-containing protein n=1 Tax=Thalassotalea loyana TaxID=280483 RepID=A0ABQ6HBY1_9GAMM|nr:hypothetical protein [Thalassotalea loyana]GLX85044.1 hypothetical protein tloyanaT_12960 [Thalassotalea loyana]
MTARKLIILREDKPTINKYIGEVIDSIPIEQFEGKEVVIVGKTFVRVCVTDLSEDLEAELLGGAKKLRTPDVQDPFYQELLSQGIVEVDEATLLNYVEIK